MTWNHTRLNTWKNSSIKMKDSRCFCQEYEKVVLKYFYWPTAITSLLIVSWPICSISLMDRGYFTQLILTPPNLNNKFKNLIWNIVVCLAWRSSSELEIVFRYYRRWCSKTFIFRRRNSIKTGWYGNRSFENWYSYGSSAKRTSLLWRWVVVF